MSADQRRLPLRAEDRLETVADHVERGDEHVREAARILASRATVSRVVRGRVVEQLVAAAVSLRSALIVAGRLPAAAAVHVEAADLVEPTRPAEPGVDAAEVRRTIVDRHAVAAVRCGLNLDDVEAAAVLRVLEFHLDDDDVDVDVDALQRVAGRLRPRVERARRARAEAQL